ncbi:MAG: hypothetical protein QJR12_09485 [Mycobacterium sp.]|uniref:hypothetical protein n=1 Tax=Mycobacterium sp. TaxID=1785 RepID=UPI0026284BD1|nr:hypothetical protein [Mycobacterium sp.]MDI3314492.1 hypothetical protein [Mycobacterium sp.]
MSDHHRRRTRRREPDPLVYELVELHAQLGDQLDLDDATALLARLDRDRLRDLYLATLHSSIQHKQQTNKRNKK